MRQIEIDDDIYRLLEQNARGFSDSPNAVLRRLLKVDQAPPPVSEIPQHREVRSVPPATAPKPPLVQPAPLQPRGPHASRGIGRLLEELATFDDRRVVRRFLFVLRWLHDQDPENFKKILAVRGDRVYFATSRQEIERSGNSTQPKPIPETSYWVTTNNDTPRKKVILTGAMRALGFAQPEIQAVCAALDSMPDWLTRSASNPSDDRRFPIFGNSEADTDDPERI